MSTPAPIPGCSMPAGSFRGKPCSAALPGAQLTGPALWRGGCPSSRPVARRRIRAPRACPSGDRLGPAYVKARPVPRHPARRGSAPTWRWIWPRTPGPDEHLSARNRDCLDRGDRSGAYRLISTWNSESRSQLLPSRRFIRLRWTGRCPHQGRRQGDPPGRAQRFLQRSGELLSRCPHAGAIHAASRGCGLS